MLSWSCSKLNNDMVMQTLGSPENLPYLKRAIGLTDYIIPGEDDRQKQYEEIQLLINSEPIMMPPDPMMMEQAMMMGMPPPPPIELPSIMADMDVDNHILEADICRRWLVSDAGRLAKLENPPGYKNVLLHMKMHKDMDMQMQMQMQMAMAPPPTGKEKEGTAQQPTEGPPPQSSGGASANAQPTIQ